MNVKYIIFNGIFPVLFTQGQKHSDYRSVGTPTSAGFCSVREENGEMKAQVWGESISLGLKSKPDDAYFIERMFSSF